VTGRRKENKEKRHAVNKEREREELRLTWWSCS
jgi:hypothetical protein